jgi:hypothetical protein
LTILIGLAKCCEEKDGEEKDGEEKDGEEKDGEEKDGEPIRYSELKKLNND